MKWYDPMIDVGIGLTAVMILASLLRAVIVIRRRPEDVLSCLRCGNENEKNAVSCSRCDPSFSLSLFIGTVSMAIGMLRIPGNSHALISGLFGFFVATMVDFATVMGTRKRARKERQ